MPSVTISREEAVQRWPVEKNAPLTAHSTAFAQVGIVQHDERVLAAHLELHLLHRVGRNAAAATRRPVATEPVNDDGAHARMPEHRLADHGAAAHDQVEHARRQAGAGDDLGQRGARSPARAPPA